jgi:predicted membrane protein
VLGLAVAGIGVLALLDNLHVFDIALLRTFWPLALVLWGVGRLFWWRHPGRGLVSIIAIGAGVVLTAQNLDLFHFSLRVWWPVFIILAGLSILLRGLVPRPGEDAGRFPAPTTATGERVELDLSFSAISQRNDSASFKGGRISSSFGGVELDLSHAAIDGPEAVLHVSACFSGINLRVPRAWMVVVEINPSFGGVENKTVPPMGPGPRLVLRGDVLFGGIEIKN